MTTTHELDCSDAAKMIIDRMRTNPEDFNYGGKLYRVTAQAQMSARDKKAYNIAHDLYIVEPALMASVLEALLTQPEDEKGTVEYRPAMTIDTSGNFGIGTQGRYAAGHIDARTIYGSPIQNDLTTQQRITREMYESHIEAHKNALKAKPPWRPDTTQSPSTSKLSDIYNKAFGRERIERDN